MPSIFSLVRVIPACSAGSRSNTPPIPTATLITCQILPQHPTPLSQYVQIDPHYPFPFLSGYITWYSCLSVHGIWSVVTYEICVIPDLLSQHRLSQQTRRRTACPAPATHRQQVIRVHRFSYFWENEGGFTGNGRKKKNLSYIYKINFQ